MAVNLTDTFIDYLFSLGEKDIPEHVIIQAKRCLLDYIGVTLAGAKMLRDKGNNVLDSLGDTQGSSTVVGFKRKANLENAVFVNGLSAHVAELDDGSRFGAIHPGSPIISALLPVAEKRNILNGKLLLGIIIGYEAAIRLAYAIQPSHYNKGFHPTSTCGSIGAAVGLSIMLDFSKEKMKDAFSSAAISASGSLKVLDDVSELKPFNIGRSGLIGFLAALMAESGFKCPNDVLSGKTGFLSMMSDESDISLLGNFEDEWLYIERIYFKSFASCRHTHPAIEAAIKIRNKHRINISDIKSVKIITYKDVIGKHDHIDIRGEYSAKMSIPFSVAVALNTGKAGLEEFSEKYTTDIETISLTQKINICSDENISSHVPQKRSAIVEITTNSNTQFSERVDFPKGEPENPLSNTELEEKFLSLAHFADKSKDECQHIIDFIWNGTNGLRGLFHLLSGEEYV